MKRKKKRRRGVEEINDLRKSRETECNPDDNKTMFYCKKFKREKKIIS